MNSIEAELGGRIAHFVTYDGGPKIGSEPAEL